VCLELIVVRWPLHLPAAPHCTIVISSYTCRYWYCSWYKPEDELFIIMASWSMILMGSEQSSHGQRPAWSEVTQSLLELYRGQVFICVMHTLLVHFCWYNCWYKILVASLSVNKFILTVPGGSPDLLSYADGSRWVLQKLSFTLRVVLPFQLGFAQACM